MKIFEINSVPYGSTGRIMFQIAEKVKKSGGIAITSCSYTKDRGIKFPKDFYLIGGILGKYIHIKLGQLTGYHGLFSIYSTLKLIYKIQKEEPDIIHIHNIHGWFLNIPLFFNFLKNYDGAVVWTLHDCWAFTGHCPFYTLIQCAKWINGCYECPRYSEYPSCYIDDSKKQYKIKKANFNKPRRMTIVTPSQWLADEVKKSFLSKYDVRVINNGIDNNIFKPTKSLFKKEYNIENKILLLGVAFDWGIRKGLDFFKQLAKDLNEQYQIVLVGITNEQKSELPQNIISIHATNSQRELAELYSCADVFINPTLEDNFPTVNLEALACGTPVITFETGGSTEAIDDTCGWVVPRGDYKMLKDRIEMITTKTDLVIKKCVEKSKNYNQDDRYMDYVKLFNTLIKEKKFETNDKQVVS